MATARTTDSGLARLGAALGDLAGVQKIARAAVDGERAALTKIASLARKHGVSDAKIARALKAKKRLDQVLSILALAFPWMPNPTLLRWLAGDEPELPEEEAVEAKKKRR